MPRPRAALSETALRRSLEAGLHVDEIARQNAISSRTVRRRIDEARAKHGAGWGTPLPTAQPTPAGATSVAGLRRAARTAVAAGLASGSTRDARERAKLGLQCLESPALAADGDDERRLTRDTGEILAALERGGRVLPADPVH